MQNIEMRSTFVHLQVYDGTVFFSNHVDKPNGHLATSHVLPLFSFTTPVCVYNFVALLLGLFASSRPSIVTEL